MEVRLIWLDFQVRRIRGALRRSYLGGRVACGIQFPHALSQVCVFLCVASPVPKEFRFTMYSLSKGPEQVGGLRPTKTTSTWVKTYLRIFLQFRC